MCSDMFECTVPPCKGFHLHDGRTMKPPDNGGCSTPLKEQFPVQDRSNKERTTSAQASRSATPTMVMFRVRS